MAQSTQSNSTSASAAQSGFASNTSSHMSSPSNEIAHQLKQFVLVGSTKAELKQQKNNQDSELKDKKDEIKKLNDRLRGSKKRAQSRLNDLESLVEYTVHLEQYLKTSNIPNAVRNGQSKAQNDNISKIIEAYGR